MAPTSAAAPAHKRGRERECTSPVNPTFDDDDDGELKKTTSAHTDQQSRTRGLRRFLFTAALSTLLLMLAVLSTFLQWDLPPSVRRGPAVALSPISSSFALDADESFGPPSPDANQSAVLSLTATTELAPASSLPLEALAEGAVTQPGTPLEEPSGSAAPAALPSSAPPSTAPQTVLSPSQGAPGVPSSPLPQAKRPVAPWLAPAKTCRVPLGDACKCLPLRRQVQSFLKNIVLVIACKSPSPSAASAFLLQVYGPLFPHMLLVAQKSNRAVTGRRKLLTGQPWATGYLHLARVIRDYPKAEGVLWVSDGMALNYWQLQAANKSKLWLSAHKEASWLLPFPSGAANAAAFPAKLAVEALGEPLRLQYAQSCGAPGTYPRRTAEAWYVPRRHFAAAKQVLPVLSGQRVPVDVGVPLLFFALEHPREYDTVLNNIIVDTVRSSFSNPLTPWNSSVSAVQPWPLGRFSFRMHLLISFSSVDCCVLEVLQKHLLLQK